MEVAKVNYNHGAPLIVPEDSLRMFRSVRFLCGLLTWTVKKFLFLRSS